MWGRLYSTRHKINDAELTSVHILLNKRGVNRISKTKLTCSEAETLEHARLSHAILNM